MTYPYASVSEVGGKENAHSICTARGAGRGLLRLRHAARTAADRCRQRRSGKHREEHRTDANPIRSRAAITGNRLPPLDDDDPGPSFVGGMTGADWRGNEPSAKILCG